MCRAAGGLPNMSEEKYEIKLLALPSWLDIKPTTGESGTTVTLKALEYNESEYSRATDVVFSAGGAKASLRVEQQSGLLPNSLQDSENYYIKDSQGNYLTSND